MNLLPSNVYNYLSKISSGNRQVTTNSRRSYNNIIVIPALAEFENIKRLLQSLAETDRKYFSNTLILFVTNNTISADYKIKSDNNLTFVYFERLLSKTATDEISKIVYDSGLNVAYIDASSKGFEMPDKDGGVGLARKIGMDSALELFDYNSEKCKIIICLDADCLVSGNYITAIIEYFNKNFCSAAVVNYLLKLRK